MNYIGKGVLNSHLQSNPDLFYIQNCFITNRVIKKMCYNKPCYNKTML